MCCQECCQYNGAKFFLFCHLFGGVLLFVGFLIFNIVLILTALVDSFITIGSFGKYHMVVSKPLLLSFKATVFGYSQTAKIKDCSHASCPEFCGYCICFLCLAPVLGSVGLSVILIPIGLVGDILILLFSLFKIKLQVTKTNLFVIKITCQTYQNLVRGDSDYSVIGDLRANIDEFVDIIKHM